MKIEEYTEPRSHMIIKNFLSKDEYKQVWKEILESEKDMKTVPFGTDQKHDISWIGRNQVGDSNSRIVQLFHIKIANEFFVKTYAEKSKSGIFEAFRFQKTWSCKISSYGEDEVYPPHNDDWSKGLLSCVLMICGIPKQFEGGDLMLEDKVIPFKNNTLIIFPSSTIHSTSPIVLNSKKYKDRRFTIQFFSEIN